MNAEKFKQKLWELAELVNDPKVKEKYSKVPGPEDGMEFSAMASAINGIAAMIETKQWAIMAHGISNLTDMCGVAAGFLESKKGV